MMNWTAKWITPACDMGSKAPCFAKAFKVEKKLARAILRLTAMGVYEAAINGQPVTDTVLNPGWTSYTKRLQVQTWDVTNLIRENNEITVLVGKGWYRSPLICSNDGTIQTMLREKPAAITAELTLTYADGAQECICTDESWTASESKVRFSELYDGEIYDATFVPAEKPNAVFYDGPTEMLVPHEGVPIREQERITGSAHVRHAQRGENHRLRPGADGLPGGQRQRQSWRCGRRVLCGSDGQGRQLLQ